MHPSQMGAFRKTIIACLTITFAGALLIFTAQANLDLLKAIYPDPQFYMFGLLALEGGTVYWTGYYLLHPGGSHKALAVFSLAVDAFLSGTGFFYEMERTTNSVGTVSLPPVITIVGFAVVFNVAMAILSHLIPSGAGSSPTPPVRPKEPEHYESGYEVQTYAQTAEIAPKGPGLLKNAAASAIAAGADIMELAREKREEKRRQRKEIPSATSAPVQVQEEKPESPKSQASLEQIQAG
jgi:hypothetical protein